MEEGGRRKEEAEDVHARTWECGGAAHGCVVEMHSTGCAAHGLVVVEVMHGRSGDHFGTCIHVRRYRTVGLDATGNDSDCCCVSVGDFLCDQVPWNNTLTYHLTL